MKKYLLDTNICIYFLKGQFELYYKFDKIGEENLLLSEITIAELKYGVAKSQLKEKNKAIYQEFIERFNILPILPALDVYAEEKARLKTKGATLDDFDLLIGATAIFNQITLVTRNTIDFNRLSRIILEDWTK